VVVTLHTDNMLIVW